MLAAIALALLLGWAGQSAFRAWRSQAAASLPPVSSAPPPTSVEAERLTDFPLTRERFEYARAHASRFDPQANPRLVEWLSAGGDAPRAGPVRCLR